MSCTMTLEAGSPLISSELERFVACENIERFKRLAAKHAQSAERSALLDLLAEEEAKPWPRRLQERPIRSLA